MGDKHLDLKMIFAQLNSLFFLDLLDGVDVAWSSRLKIRGAYCGFNPATRYCCIRVNEPYYRTRPPSELIGALLHEMVHAVMFLHDTEEDDGDHGPLFCWYVEELNKQLGGKIKVPVVWDADPDEILQHWWQCSGPCQHILKLAINRPPSYRHTCGGTYMKVKEPENDYTKGKRKRTTGDSSDPTLNVGEGSHQNRYPKRRRVA